jgi:hypothetical protein
VQHATTIDSDAERPLSQHSNACSQFVAGGCERTGLESDRGEQCVGDDVSASLRTIGLSFVVTPVRWLTTALTPPSLSSRARQR